MYELYQFLAIFFFIWFILFFISLFNYKVRQKVFMGYSRKKITVIYFIVCFILLSISSLLQKTDSFKAGEQQALAVQHQKDLEQQEKDRQKAIEELQKNNPTAKFFDLKSQEEVNKIEAIYSSVGIKVNSYGEKFKYSDSDGSNRVDITAEDYNYPVYVDYNENTKEIKNIFMAGNKYLLKNGQVINQISKYQLSNFQRIRIDNKATEIIKAHLKSPDDAEIKNNIYIGDDEKIHIDSVVKARNSFGVYVTNEFHHTFD